MFIGILEVSLPTLLKAKRDMSLILAWAFPGSASSYMVALKGVREYFKVREYYFNSILFIIA